MTTPQQQGWGEEKEYIEKYSADVMGEVLTNKDIVDFYKFLSMTADSGRFLSERAVSYWFPKLQQEYEQGRKKEEEKKALVMEIVEAVERTIQEERYSGAPYALNKIKETITAIAEKHGITTNEK